MTTTQQLAEATSNWTAARHIFDTTKVGSKAWKLAAEDLEFWGSKMAMLNVMVERAA